MTDPLESKLINVANYLLLICQNNIVNLTDPMHLTQSSLIDNLCRV